MDKVEQTKKAEQFLALHHDPKLLVLPNIWDPLGARLLERLGFPAVATASAAVAFSLGYDDGQRITFDAMLGVVDRVVRSVDVPVTADVEAGYAEEPEEVAENIQRVLRLGVVGINLEDGTGEGSPLRGIAFQCERIRAVRRMAQREGIPLVINARTDVFLGGVSGSREKKVEETISRGRAYLEAGADCIYPITVGDIETLKRIRDGTKAPLNVYASPSAAPMKELEAAGISRLSLGPGMIKASVTALKNIALELQRYGSYDLFTKDVVSSEEIQDYVTRNKMK